MNSDQNHSSFIAGVLCGMLLMVGSQAIHWFITPMSHPEAGTVRAIGVVLQAVVGFGGAAYLYFRSHRPRVAA